MRPFFRITKLPSHKRFTYHPRYWDPEKEALEARLKKYRDRKDGESDVELTKSRISSNFRARRGGGKFTSSRKGNFRLVVILITIIILTYFFLNRYANLIVNWIE